MFPNCLSFIILVCDAVHIQDLVATLKASVAVSSVNGHFFDVKWPMRLQLGPIVASGEVVREHSVLRPIA